MLNLQHKAECELFTPDLDSALYIARRLPADEIQQTELFTGQAFDPDAAAMWVHNARFKIACRTLEGEPIAICGFLPVGSGVYRTLFLATEKAWSEYGAELTGYTQAGMLEIIERENIRRLETVCLASRTKAQAWYRLLGLKFESTLQSYAANGEDAVMFTKVK